MAFYQSCLPDSETKKYTQFHLASGNTENLNWYFQMNGKHPSSHSTIHNMFFRKSTGDKYVPANEQVANAAMASSIITDVIGCRPSVLATPSEIFLTNE